MPKKSKAEINQAVTAFNTLCFQAQQLCLTLGIQIKCIQGHISSAHTVELLQSTAASNITVLIRKLISFVPLQLREAS